MSDVLKISTPTGDDEANQIADAKALAEKKARITQLEKSNADLEKLIAQKGGGGAPAREGMRKNAEYKAVSTAPSINKTPRGRSTPRLPYPTVQDLSNSEAIVPTVTLNGDPAYVLNQTVQPSCKGDDPGTALGVKSGTVNGYVKPTGASSTVTMGGQPSVRIGDPCVMNGGNNPGLYVTAAPAAANPAKSAASTGNPPPNPETAQEKQWYERWWDNAKGDVGRILDHPVKATLGAAGGTINQIPGFFELLAKGSALKQAAQIEQTAALQSLFGQTATVQSSLDAAQALREGAEQISLPQFDVSSDPNMAAGDHAATLIQLAVGGVWIIKGVGKGIPALLKEAKVAETVAADTAKGAGKTAAKGVDEAADVAATGAAKAAKSPGDGVVIKPFRGKIRFRSAKDVHEELLDKHRVTKDTLPFKDGTTVTEREMMPGERFNMSMDDEQLKNLLDPASEKGVGGWGTSETFNSQSEALNGMAIKPEFKPYGIPNTVELEVVKPFRTLDGIAGPQGSLTGGSQQYFVDLPRTGAKAFVRVVNVTRFP